MHDCSVSPQPGRISLYALLVGSGEPFGAIMLHKVEMTLDVSGKDRIKFLRSQSGHIIKEPLSSHSSWPVDVIHFSQASSFCSDITRHDLPCGQPWG